MNFVDSPRGLCKVHNWLREMNVSERIIQITYTEFTD